MINQRKYCGVCAWVELFARLRSALAARERLQWRRHAATNRVGAGGRVPRRFGGRFEGRAYAPGAFTLLELLVVIAIISVLAVLAVPTLRRTMESSGEAKCANNLRNLVSGWTVYCGENDGNTVIYRPDYPKNDPGRLYNVWITNLLPYIGGGNIDQLLLCPAASKPPAVSSRGGPFNAWRFGSHSGRTFLGSYGFVAAWYLDLDFMYPNPVILAAVKQSWFVKNINTPAPSNTVVFSDAPWIDFGGPGSIPTVASVEAGSGSGWQMARHRNKGVNMAFADGHVSFVTVGEGWGSVLFNKIDVVPRPTDLIPSQFK